MLRKDLTSEGQLIIFRSKSLFCKAEFTPAVIFNLIELRALYAALIETNHVTDKMKKDFSFNPFVTNYQVDLPANDITIFNSWKQSYIPFITHLERKFPALPNDTGRMTDFMRGCRIGLTEKQMNIIQDYVPAFIFPVVHFHYDNGKEELVPKYLGVMSCKL